MKYFISHSFRDKDVVDLFVAEILSRGLQILPGNLFYSSGVTTGIAMGNNLIDTLKNKLKETNAFIPIFSPNYLGSKMCLVELGAAWLMDIRTFPFVIPPFSYRDLSTVIDYDKVIVNVLNRDDHLDHFKDEHDTMDSSAPASVLEWNTAKRRFITNLGEILARPRPCTIMGKRLLFKSSMDLAILSNVTSTLAEKHGARSVMVCTYPDPRRPHEVEIDFETELEMHAIIATITEIGSYNEIGKDLRLV